MWVNYHTHCNYCDGKSPMQEYVDEAERLNLLSIGFSSHAPIPFDTKWCMKSQRLEEYIQDIETIRKTKPLAEIYTGLEVDFVPNVTSPNLFKEKLDYTIGSVHFVDSLPDGRHWEIDGNHALFLEGLSKIFHNNIQSAISRYFELTREMIATACPTVIGHLDKIKIQNVDGKFFSETESWYQNEVQRTIDMVSSSGAIVEVNTRGLYQRKSDTTYPSPWILALLHEKNIPITISSDAHHPKDLVKLFSETAKLLRNIGFKTIAILTEGTWKSFSFSEHGIEK
jgi:histidinol-phosphatase (PHP family)